MAQEELDFSQIPPWRRWVVQWDISHNAIPLAFFAFTSMWQTASQHFGMFKVPQEIWFTLYFMSCTILAVSIVLFLLRIFIHPAAIAADFHHPRLVNFFFMPVMIGPLCVITTPPFPRSLGMFVAGFYILSAYQLGLALYLYGEWLFGSQPTGFIHPLVFMQTIGFFLCANIGATAHLLDQAYFMFSVGALFWLLVFFTNFQHVSLALDKKCERPQPTMFLFIAPPAQAALSVVVLELAEKAKEAGLTDGLLSIPKEMEWPRLAQGFMAVDLFLYLLMFRLFPTFWTTKFAISWWAYIFPLSAAAGMTIWRYKSEDKIFWGVLAALLVIIACTAMLVVLCFTIFAVFAKRVPHNPAALNAYHQYYVGSNSAATDDDIEAGMSGTS